MMRIVIDTQQLGKLSQNIQRLSNDFPRMFANAVWDIGKDAEQFTKQEVPKRTGELAQSIRASRVGDYSWEIVEGKPYGIYVRYGVKPRDHIYPRLKKALYWEGLAHPISFVGPPMTRKWPGFKANPYHERVEIRIRDKWAETIKILGSRMRIYMEKL